MTVTHAHKALAEAIGIAIEELDGLIDRLFVANRVVRVERGGDEWYCAMLYAGGTGRLIFPPTPNLDTVIRFVRAFAIKTPGVTVDEDSVEFYRAERAGMGHSVRVPSNVVPIGGRT